LKPDDAMPAGIVRACWPLRAHASRKVSRRWAAYIAKYRKTRSDTTTSRSFTWRSTREKSLEQYRHGDSSRSGFRTGACVASVAPPSAGPEQ
jgi:hypothetical protein